jgi:hypothetical protein
MMMLSRFLEHDLADTHGQRTTLIAVAVIWPVTLRGRRGWRDGCTP